MQDISLVEGRSQHVTRNPSVIKILVNETTCIRTCPFKEVDQMITLLDYGAGNVRSVINAIEKLGGAVKIASNPEDVIKADKLIFPGVGSFGSMMHILEKKNYVDPLSLIHISEPTRPPSTSRMPSSA